MLLITIIRFLVAGCCYPFLIIQALPSIGFFLFTLLVSGETEKGSDGSTIDRQGEWCVTRTEIAISSNLSPLRVASVLKPVN